MPCRSGADRMDSRPGARTRARSSRRPQTRSQGEPVKKSNKIAAAAAAGALLLTGGLTAAANAGTSQVLRLPCRAGRCSGAVPAVDVQPVAGNRGGAEPDQRGRLRGRGQGRPRQMPGGQTAVRHGGPGGQVRHRAGPPPRATTPPSTPLKRRSRRPIPLPPSARPPANWPSASTATGPASRTSPAPCSWPAASRSRSTGCPWPGIGVGGAPDGTLDEACATPAPRPSLPRPPAQK